MGSPRRVRTASIVVRRPSVRTLSAIALIRSGCWRALPTRVAPANSSSIRSVPAETIDASSCAAVPERWAPALDPVLGDVVERVEDARPIGPDESVRPLGDRDRSLCVLAQGEGGDAQRGRLLLDPARVGEDDLRGGLEAE